MHASSLPFFAALLAATLASATMILGTLYNEGNAITNNAWVYETGVNPCTASSSQIAFVSWPDENPCGRPFELDGFTYTLENCGDSDFAVWYDGAELAQCVDYSETDDCKAGEGYVATYMC